MATLIHVITFVCSIGIIWFFAGVLIDSVNRIAHRFNKTGFMTSFFLLGFLTSLGEISVAINASIQGVPDVSVGNLLGASFVLLMFVIPLLAVVGKGIELKDTLSKKALALALSVIILPIILVMDGAASKADGLISLLAYACLMYVMYHQKRIIRKSLPVGAAREVIEEHRLTVGDFLRIVMASIAVFGASKLLVEQAVYFSSAFGISVSLVGLFLLSIGTNIPELVVVAKSVVKRHKDIAFGDYIGSAAVNTFLFGALASFNGTFFFDHVPFQVITALMVFGTMFFYVFAQSSARISRGEGVVLLLFYACFIIFYSFNLASVVVH